MFDETNYVGSGAFGDVFKCGWGPSLENTPSVAVKVIRLPFASLSAIHEALTVRFQV